MSIDQSRLEELDERVTKLELDKKKKTEESSEDDDNVEKDVEVSHPLK